jgi:hypothetical protein
MDQIKLLLENFRGRSFQLEYSTRIFDSYRELYFENPSKFFDQFSKGINKVEYREVENNLRCFLFITEEERNAFSASSLKYVPMIEMPSDSTISAKELLKPIQPSEEIAIPQFTEPGVRKTGDIAASVIRGTDLGPPIPLIKNQI